MRCIRPHLSDETVPVLQKRVYFCLLRICHYHAPFIVSTMLAEFSSLLMESILTLNIVSKRYRLKCLFFVCKALSAQNPEHIQFCMSLLPEVILCLKDASKKVRAICYDLIVLFAELMHNSSVAYELPDHTQAQASLQQFLVTLTACLVSENPHMQAAALMSISCVVNHFRGEEALRDVEWAAVGKQVMIAFFEGEAWGRAGSRAFLSDVTDFECLHRVPQASSPFNDAMCSRPLRVAAPFPLHHSCRCASPSWTSAASSR